MAQARPLTNPSCAGCARRPIQRTPRKEVVILIHTRLCDLLGIEHPIVQAGMARQQTGAELVAAVSAAGGLGILGCLGRTADEAVTEIRHIRTLTDRPFGVNFVLHLLDENTFATCLAERVPVFSFFRGDPGDVVARAHAIGAAIIHQVTTIKEAVRAHAVGIDVLVAQGTEAGGHQGHVPLLSLLPEVVAVSGGRPVLTAGGIVDGPGIAAVLCLGASGVMMGTRFIATPECPASAAHKGSILGAEPSGTVASSIFDIIWGDEWPGVQARAVRNSLSDRWVGRDAALSRVREEALVTLQRAEANDDPQEMILLARLAILELLLDGEKSVSELVAAIGATQSRVSNHLACLRWCGLVTVRREGNYVYYNIADPRVGAVLALAGEQAMDFSEALASCGRLSDDGVPSY